MDPKVDGVLEWVNQRKEGEKCDLPAECSCLCGAMIDTSGIHSSGTNLHQTWAAMHLNMVNNVQTTQGALESSIQTFLSKAKSLRDDKSDGSAGDSSASCRIALLTPRTNDIFCITLPRSALSTLVQ